MLEVFQKVFAKWGLKFSSTKTFAAVFNEKYADQTDQDSKGNIKTLHMLGPAKEKVELPFQDKAVLLGSTIDFAKGTCEQKDAPRPSQ